MNIALIGAGIIGVTTAYELARDGHQVTVFERHGAAAEEASFAGAGLVTPGMLDAWVGPGRPAQAWREWLTSPSASRLGPRLGVRELAWLWRWWRACRPTAYPSSHASLLRLASHSLQQLERLRTELSLEYDHAPGHLLLLRSARERQRLQPALELLRAAGGSARELSAAEARQIEPALQADTVLEAAIHLPQDEAGNCRQFALLLKNEALRLGVRFEFNTAVRQLQPGPRPSLVTEQDGTARHFDAVVLCAGVASAGLLRPLGLKIPLLPVQGHSVNAALREPLHAPRGAVTDVRHRVAIARVGQRVRVAGGAEIACAPGGLRRESLRLLYQVLQDWFPGAATMSVGVQEWRGARPLLPDGLPLLGASGLNGIWLNLGHGDHGWSLGCGSARALADQLGGRASEFDLTSCSIERFR